MISGKISSGLLASILALSAFLAGFALFVIFDKAVLGPGEVPAEYVYDISSLTKIDPDQILYKPAADPIQLDLKSVVAIDIDAQNRICVAGDKQILIFDSPAGQPRRIDLSAEPTCLKADGDRLYVGLGNHIEVVGSEAAEQWPPPAEDAWLTSIAAAGDNVFAADAKNKVVWHFDRQGKLLKAIGKKDLARNIPGFIVPNPSLDILMASDGLLRAVNPGRHCIEAYTEGGDLEWSWGKPGVSLEGFSGCCNPVALAVLPYGGFVTGEKGLVRVKEYDAEGNYVGVVAGPDQLGWSEPIRVCDEPQQCQSKTLDVAVDSGGTVYVLDCVKGIIHQFEKK